MRIEDLEEIEKDLPYNLVDDMAIYMRNDPTFYRKAFFPAVLKMKEMFQKKQAYDPAAELGPLIDKAAKNYCKKYKIQKRFEDLFADDDRENLIKKIYSEEMSNIKKDVY